MFVCAALDCAIYACRSCITRKELNTELEMIVLQVRYRRITRDEDIVCMVAPRRNARSTSRVIGTVDHRQTENMHAIHLPERPLKRRISDLTLAVLAWAAISPTAQGAG